MPWHEKVILSEFESLNIERLKSFDEFNDGEESLVQQLIDLYLEITPGEILSLKLAVESDDFEKARKIAHGLKSSSANLGADELAADLQEIEDSTTSQKSLFKTVDEEYTKVCTELKRIRSFL